MLPDECHRTPSTRSQHWICCWLGGVRQQTFTWANCGPDLCPIWRHWVKMSQQHNFNFILFYTWNVSTTGSTSGRISSHLVHNILHSTTESYFKRTKAGQGNGILIRPCKQLMLCSTLLKLVMVNIDGFYWYGICIISIIYRYMICIDKMSFDI